ncbi:MAG: XcyI family restriction endonuclease [Dehalococcoidia bacterium]
MVAARSRWLLPALQQVLGEIDPEELSAELGTYASSEARQVLAGAGIRDEYVFPVPLVLQSAPMLLGYYRLLLGRPQKSFYSGSVDGFGMFKSMEERGVLTRAQAFGLSDLCRALCQSLADLVTQLSPTVTQADLDQLPLLTLGSQLQGSNNNAIGRQATQDVFTSIQSIIPEERITRNTATEVEFTNLTGRTMRVTLAADPDVRIEEYEAASPSESIYKLAIEIKGGTDRSNAHNRAGEAEKSHQKAYQDGCPEFWTIIATRGVDVERLKVESPTTNHFFDSAEILAMAGPGWDRFVSRLKSTFGVQ